MYGNEGDTKFSLLRYSSNYFVNTILFHRMKFVDNKLECILMGLNCEDCQNREFTRLESECFNSCSLYVIVIDIDSSKFKKIIESHNSGDIVYSYWEREEEESGDDFNYTEC